MSLVFHFTEASSLHTAQVLPHENFRAFGRAAVKTGSRKLVLGPVLLELLQQPVGLGGEPRFVPVGVLECIVWYPRSNECISRFPLATNPIISLMVVSVVEQTSEQARK